jgi:hypothetical protein
VGTSDRQILDNPAQLSASLSLTLWLMSAYRISLRNVIGHNESLTSPYHRERYRPWRCQTHGDWTHADMKIYRTALARLARRYGVRWVAVPPPSRPTVPDASEIAGGQDAAVDARHLLGRERRIGERLVEVERAERCEM